MGSSSQNLRMENTQRGSCFQNKNKNQKKKKNNNLKDYRPFSLCGSKFTFFTENSLIYQSHSGFITGGSCTKQLLLIMHQIYKSIGNGHVAWSVFLGITKDFNKVWRKSLISKLKKNGVSSNLLSNLTNFLRFRKQRVILNSQLFSWSKFESSVPQGSIFSRLLFLTYI